MQLIAVDAGLNQKAIQFDPLATGILVNDIMNGVGLVKDGSITAAAQLANPNAYVTTDCLGATIAGTLSAEAQNATTTFLLYSVSVTKNQLLRVSPALFMDSFGTTTNVQLKLLYKDKGGTTVTVNLMNFTPGVANPVISPMVIYAQKNSSVQLRVELNVGNDNYSIYANCEYLGVQNI